MFKFLTFDFRRNLIKIFCLSTGLAIGMLLVAKVYFEQTFDSFLPDIDRIYIVTECVDQKGEYKEYTNTPGGVAPGMIDYVPQVECATRFFPLFGNTKAVTDDGRRFEVPVVYLADSCFFDVIQTEILSGDYHEALGVEWKCMIPKTLADKIGGDVIGMSLSSPDLGDDRKLEVAAVYADFPLNSSFRNGIYISLETIPHFMYDGRGNWMGNDMYSSYVKLREGANREETGPYIKKMLEDNIGVEVLKETGFNFGLIPLGGNHAASQGIRTMNWMLSILALIILGSASLNFLLVVIAQMQWRAKEMAVRKCYGTGNRQIFHMVIIESLFFMLISLGFAALIVTALSSQCEQLLGVKTSDLLSTARLWTVEVVICLVLLFVTGIVPAWLYCRTPVTNVFRKETKNKRIWKRVLLSIQIFASSFLFCLLVLVGRQYHHIANADMGYDYENVATAFIHRIPSDGRKKIVEELRRLGCVKEVATADRDLTSYATGNNILNENDRFYEVNIADMEYANPEIFPVMGMKFIQGEPFEAYSDSSSSKVVVERGFINDLRKVQKFEGDWIVGRSFPITGHLRESENSNVYEVCGVIEPLRKNGFSTDGADLRSGVIFPSASFMKNLYVRFNHMDRESLEEARSLIDSLYPDAEITLMPLKSKLDVLNAPVRRFGMSVMIAGVVIILITLIGLIGYTLDEVQRRAKEIAIRKVNGMSIKDILRIFCIDILKVAVPALLAGYVAAPLVGKEWISQFTEQVGLSPLSMLATVIAILTLLLVVVIVCSLGIIKENPVKYLRNE